VPLTDDRFLVLLQQTQLVIAGAAGQPDRSGRFAFATTIRRAERKADIARRRPAQATERDLISDPARALPISVVNQR
jgi:hypothetical protein